MGKQDKMSSKFDRRSFLTHSAATIGGVAMAGTVADEFFANTAGAAVAFGYLPPGLWAVQIQDDARLVMHTWNGNHSANEA